jgi:uncharacterized membrane protein
MTENRSETAKRFLAKELEKLSEQKRLVVERFINRGRVARNVAREFEEKLTFGQQLADRFAQIIGSWRFIIIQSAMMAVWLVRIQQQQLEMLELLVSEDRARRP